jgi:hypothetical protein
VRRKRAGKATLLDPDLFKAKLFKFGVSGQLLQQIALGGTMIALPIYLQIVLEYSAMGGWPVDCPAVTEHVRGGPGRREKRGQAAPGEPDPGGVRAVHDRAGHRGADDGGPIRLRRARADAGARTTLTWQKDGPFTRRYANGGGCNPAIIWRGMQLPFLR